MSEHDQRDLCTEFDTDMTTYNKLDFMMLTRALKSSYVVAKAHLNGDGDQNTYKELKKSYSNYSCRVKSQIDDANNRRLITGKVVYVCFMLFSVWIMYMMYKQLKNAFSMKPVSITIINALIVIIVMNPIFSFVTITMDIMNYSSSNAVPMKHIEDIDRLESLLRDAVDCEENFDAKISKFVKAFEESDLFITLDTQRMDKINQIQQFILNHKGFLEKNNNPNLVTQVKDLAEDTFDFIFGKDEKLLSDMFDSEFSSSSKQSSRTGMYYKTSKQVRSQTPKILNYMDPNIDPSTVESYAKYFLDDLNDNLIRLVGYVTQHSIHLRMGFVCENPNVQQYIGVDKASAILDAFSDLSTRIRRLKMLSLPEYDYLMKCLNPSNTQEWNRLLLEFDKSMSNQRDLYTIMEIFMNNTTYFFTVSSSTEDDCKLVERKVVKRIDGVNYDVTVPALSCDLKPNFGGCATIHESMSSFDIREIYASFSSNYMNADSMIYQKTMDMIQSFQTTPLDGNFRKNYKMEVDVIMDVLSSKLDNVDWTVDQVMQVFDSRVRQSTQNTELQDTFSENSRVLFEELKIITEERKLTGELTYDKREAIENPTNFVSFEQFNNKLSSMSHSEYMLLHKSILETSKNVSFFHDRMDQINNSMDRKIFMGTAYWRYIIIYYVVSFLLLSEYLWKYYTGETVDISLLSKLEVRRLNKK